MENIRQEYLDYLDSFTKIRNLDHSTEFLLPLFDRNGDQLTVFIDKKGEKYSISDDGYFVTNLLISGMVLKGKREEAIEHLCRIKNVKLEGNELLMETNRANLPQDLHTFGQVLLQIDDMYLTSKSRVASFFLDDVRRFFDDHNLSYVSEIEVKGRSGLNQAIQFCFSKNRQHPERLCITINNATKDKAMNSVFIWEDIKNNRKKGSEFVVIINDDNKVFPEFDAVLNEYGVKSVKYSKMEDFIGYFS